MTLSLLSQDFLGTQAPPFISYPLPANLYSLQPNILCRIFWMIDPQSRCSFALTCKQVSRVTEYSSRIEKIYIFITQTFSLIKESSFVERVSLFDMLHVKGMVLSEIHVSEVDRQCNSELVDLCWDIKKVSLFLESESDQQIAYAPEEIRQDTKCWDISSLEKKTLFGANAYLEQTCCVLCIAYLNHFAEGNHDFPGFFTRYRMIKSRLHELVAEYGSKELSGILKTDLVEAICKKGEETDDKNKKRQCLLKLVCRLKQETRMMMSCVSHILDQQDERRNNSLCSNLEQAISQDQFPIVIAGREHVVSKEVQTLGKKPRWGILSLDRKVRGKNSGPPKKIELLFERLACELQGSPLEPLARIEIGITQAVTKEALHFFLVANRDLFISMKTAMRDSCSCDKWLPIWADVPDCIYLFDAWVLGSQKREISV